MPNWVTNTLTITGEPELLAEVGARLRAPIPNSADHTETQPKFSFWNIIKPEDSILDEYFANADSTQLSNGNNWYNWNNRNWGCKWDARVHFAEMVDGNLVYEFDTAWAPPIQVLETLSRDIPDAKLTLRFVEEQGWGGVTVFKVGEVYEEEAWDIPDTHEEAVKVFGECWHCDDPGNLYQDCPESQASQSHEKDIELMGECRWCEINEDGRYEDCPEE
ncbi:hypothetical protein UFOVP696_99 [uncultured Caudovirales phage]|uniref:YubB ferredoxin-like domain-containing protein n=1 Tax=uncultured Caudovirales phage TaxID=2100421 RepID=A0A6J5NLG0_9CAUD|nr:hypothetical protein UFOVP429_68 [uncultured Caudovirales phage]CAB4158231.1 hypothetical protein UFOVP696_99 [uncultured Caudovirales phage]